MSLKLFVDWIFITCVWLVIEEREREEKEKNGKKGAKEAVEVGKGMRQRKVRRTVEVSGKAQEE